MFLAGPPLLKAATGEIATDEELGGAQMHAEVAGTAEYLAENDADGVRLVTKRPYIDGKRVGIVGHSYGGFMAAMGVFKFPDVYAAASIGAGVTDWRNYDTIYTERYMSTPQLNKKGYDIGRVMTYAKNLKGKALILHGMVDDNVHPNNAFQLIAALDQAGLSYESRFWPNGGHGLGRGASDTRWEFLDRVLKP